MPNLENCSKGRARRTLSLDSNQMRIQLVPIIYYRIIKSGGEKNESLDLHRDAKAGNGKARKLDKYAHNTAAEQNSRK